MDPSSGRLPWWLIVRDISKWWYIFVFIFWKNAVVKPTTGIVKKDIVYCLFLHTCIPKRNSIAQQKNSKPENCRTSDSINFEMSVIPSLLFFSFFFRFFFRILPPIFRFLKTRKKKIQNLIHESFKSLKKIICWSDLWYTQPPGIVFQTRFLKFHGRFFLQ